MRGLRVRVARGDQGRGKGARDMSEPIRDRIVRLFNEARLREEQAPRYRVSNADGCARAHVYAFDEAACGPLSPSYSPARWNLAAVLGTAMGDFLEKAARRLGDRTQVP